MEKLNYSLLNEGTSTVFTSILRVTLDEKGYSHLTAEDIADRIADIYHRYHC